MPASAFSSRMATMALETSVRLRPEGTTGHAPSEVSASPSVGFGRATVVAGVEDTLAAVRTAVLLARSLGATLQVYVPGTEGLEIHFGQARCDGLLAGLVDLFRERLTGMAPPTAASFNVEINFSDLLAISIQIHNAAADQK